MSKLRCRAGTDSQRYALPVSIRYPVRSELLPILKLLLALIVLMKQRSEYYLGLQLLKFTASLRYHHVTHSAEPTYGLPAAEDGAPPPGLSQFYSQHGSTTRNKERSLV